mgnify:CR=1 FL=1
MKIAVSIPDSVYEQAEEVAKRLEKSRSELYAEALAEYLARRQPDAVTSQINEALDAMDSRDAEAFGAAAAHRTLARSEW